MAVKIRRLLVLWKDAGSQKRPQEITSRHSTNIKRNKMEKRLYWLVESNRDLSVTVQDFAQVKELIEGDFANENEDGKFEIDDLQYTITPQMMTQEEFENLPEA